jgi:hypothetical protein
MKRRRQPPTSMLPFAGFCQGAFCQSCCTILYFIFTLQLSMNFVTWVSRMVQYACRATVSFSKLAPLPYLPCQHFHCFRVMISLLSSIELKAFEMDHVLCSMRLAYQHLGKVPILASNIAYISRRTHDPEFGCLQAFHWPGPTHSHIFHPIRTFLRMQRASCSVHFLTS